MNETYKQSDPFSPKNPVKIVKFKIIKATFILYLRKSLI